MKELFFRGGPLFMGILTILLIVMLAWMIYHFVLSYFSKEAIKENALRKMKYGKSIGLFAMITGILGQFVGLYEAFSVIEKVDNIKPALVFGGIKVSMIATLYGIIIYLLAILLWFIASTLLEKKLNH